MQLQSALLSNADSLLQSALTLLDLGRVALARSLAILGLEESGKAIAVHERRVAMPHLPEGSSFRCDSLDELWSSHQRKLEAVYSFLHEEKYWFGTHEPDLEGNAALLGSIRKWADRHSRHKERGFYVEIGSQGHIKAPTDASEEASLKKVIERVHQIGWQLRLGEHIEGKIQDQDAAGIAPLPGDSLTWLENADLAHDVKRDLLESLRAGVSGRPLSNAAYRFNPPGADRSPFRTVGKPGYEAEDRELLALQQRMDDERDGVW